MRESIELPLLDSSLQPRIALARVNDQAQLDGLKCGFRLYNSLQQVSAVTLPLVQSLTLAILLNSA